LGNSERYFDVNLWTYERFKVMRTEILEWLNWYGENFARIFVEFLNEKGRQFFGERK
jgi:hypothetical protein